MQKELTETFGDLLSFNATDRVQEQKSSLDLLLEKYSISSRSNSRPPFKDEMSDVAGGTIFFHPSAVQRQIYHNDSGTAFVPQGLKNRLLRIQDSGIIRPGTLADMQKFVRTARTNKIHYTIRGSGTWPFGGAIPLNRDIILDLSALNFFSLDEETQLMTVGPGLVFAQAKKALQHKGYMLKQEITNPHSGTICGWIATGGLGLGSFRHGHIRQSVRDLLWLTPDGEFECIHHGDDDFDMLFESEGQLGIVAGAVIEVKKINYSTKPFAFSFLTIEDVHTFMNWIYEWELQPTSVLYFDEHYIAKSHEIAQETVAHQLQNSLTLEDNFRISQWRIEQDRVETLRDIRHGIVMEFDSSDAVQSALRHTPFSSTEPQRSYRDVPYWRLPTTVAHLLWEHRFMPVSMKQKGPSMLVSETVIPFEKFPQCIQFLQNTLTNWLDNPIKVEAHFLPDKEALVQTIILADTALMRHKIYFSLVPLMTEMSLYFGGRTYGTGIWNSPFIKKAFGPETKSKLSFFRTQKKSLDPAGLINQGKFFNKSGRLLLQKMYARWSDKIFYRLVHLLHEGKIKGKGMSLYAPGKFFWKINRFVFPYLVPPAKKARRGNLESLTVVCAECDSCEKVCPTSDVFGMWGIATPVTRRKTAQRIAQGVAIGPEEALGFLMCTRCDNCSRICPTDIPLTELFDQTEENPLFQSSLKSAFGLNDTVSEQHFLEVKNDFIERFWVLMKESKLYREHTKSVLKENRTHLEHGLTILYSRGFAYGSLFIDPQTCIRCGICAHEHACTYGARKGRPRSIPELLEHNCALCNACINFCPQNKAIHEEREFFEKSLLHAVDREEKKYWQYKIDYLRDTTIIKRSDDITEMADAYMTEEIIMEIDREASTGNIPVSGMGQGDRHMGIGFDAERFSHFHIVGPAQNRLHEGDPDEELSVTLGKRYRSCLFDQEGNLHNPPYHKIRLRSPMLYNTIPLESNGRVETAFILTAHEMGTLVVIELPRLLDHYRFILDRTGFINLPPVIVPRLNGDFINQLQIHSQVSREFLEDLWKMPLFEFTFHNGLKRSIEYVRHSVIRTQTAESPHPLFAGYLDISEHDLEGTIELGKIVREQIDTFLREGMDVLHINGLRNKDNYFTTSIAVRAVHHYLINLGRRHEVSLIASGGIRLASDSQKTIQRGAEATLIDIAALLALDPDSYKAIIEGRRSSENLLGLDIHKAITRLRNQMESRKIQILEVLGASGFKDLKKTVGEEGRLIDFHELEDRLDLEIFTRDETIEQTIEVNADNIESSDSIHRDDAEFRTETTSFTYSELRKALIPLASPHDFYKLGEINQTVYQRDHVWPGWVIETMGKMAAGDISMQFLRNVRGTGLLGDGFDVMKILYNRDPDIIAEAELDSVQSALILGPRLTLRQPWMLGGKSVGSVGLDTWRAHVLVSRELGLQFDTGEGGYPTSFFLNRHGEPIFLTEPDMSRISPFFIHDTSYRVHEILDIVRKHFAPEENQSIIELFSQFPERQPFLFYTAVAKIDEAFVSTEMKTGLFGVTKESIKRARRVVIAYSQGAKMGIGGHILARKVNKLVSYLRGIQGIEYVNTDRLKQFIRLCKKIQREDIHPLKQAIDDAYTTFIQAFDEQTIFPELREWLWKIQNLVYELNHRGELDHLESEQIIRLCEEIIDSAYSSVISPFPFHNCYSIEDVKAFIDMVRMINPEAVVSVKVSPSVDIEFIAAGLARIAKDIHQTEELYKNRLRTQNSGETRSPGETGVQKLEIWLDGPRGGTGASPNIIKGQMGMHIEYAIPLIHNRLMADGLRNYVSFMVSGGIRTYEDVIKSVALGADGVIWGTAPLVAIGCDRNRNCHDGCSRGIATSNLIMQNLRDVTLNSLQMMNAFRLMQMQVIRSLAGLGFSDIRQLRGRHDKIQWIGLKERVDFRRRRQATLRRKQPEPSKQNRTQPLNANSEIEHQPGQSNCGVAAIIGSTPIPSYVLDKALTSMRNRGMDGVGIGKTLCYPEHPEDYAFRLMVKGVLQSDIEEGGALTDPRESRKLVINERSRLATEILNIFLSPFCDIKNGRDIEATRDPYKRDEQGNERDYREFGDRNTDPGDIFTFFLRIKEPVLFEFIENELLVSSRYAYIREFFPNINRGNYKIDNHYLRKAEDLFVFKLSTEVTQLLYLWEPLDNGQTPFRAASAQEQSDDKKVNGYTDWHHYLTLLREFSKQRPISKWGGDYYKKRVRKLAAVMSCGKNFAIWKTAGREICWETPAAPNNIIHVRLATGSIVEQMNAHPFGKLHTALTHNGETTNYVTLRQRVEQFGLVPMATTDTEVASLKFHLVADELEYPDWAIFESFSPTTGDDLALIAEEKRHQLEEVQRVEFTSSPDGPYQYLCLRHRPEEKMTERIDLKDPADLRPSTTAIWKDAKDSEQSRIFCGIASEEQALHVMFEELDALGLIDGALPDKTFVSPGMISRFYFDSQNRITDTRFFDRYGDELCFEDFGQHYSMNRKGNNGNNGNSPLVEDVLSTQGSFKSWFRKELPTLEFSNYLSILDSLRNRVPEYLEAEKCLTILTWLIDYLRTLNTGSKAKSSLRDMTQKILDSLFDELSEKDPTHFMKCSFNNTNIESPKDAHEQTLLIDARGFAPEGTGPDTCLAAFLGKTYDLGWRRFVLYRVQGQRLLSTAVMGYCDTDDVVMDVYGIPGEYFGAFMQGGLVRLHGNAQNFCGLCMHHGTLQVFGNAGKVCGYASKGGYVYILGDVVDRVWTNSVNDPRCMDLKVHILGTASKYAGESLMGGDFFFAGLTFDQNGSVRIQQRPFRGTKLLGGASRGNMLFFNPYDRLSPKQYSHGKVTPIADKDWIEWREMAQRTLEMAGIDLFDSDGKPAFKADDKTFIIERKNFTLITPKGGLKGYESH